MLFYFYSNLFLNLWEKKNAHLKSFNLDKLYCNFFNFFYFVNIKTWETVFPNYSMYLFIFPISSWYVTVSFQTLTQLLGSGKPCECGQSSNSSKVGQICFEEGLKQSCWLIICGFMNYKITFFVNACKPSNEFVLNVLILSGSHWVFFK